ncbi:MAG: glycosyltransferase [Acidobacteriaceae bacterium]|jgi:glycosyltransferase involved in cell wall biosynthesis|nr:glycosyltransferase [Acidobacteriaceae bacterium]
MNIQMLRVLALVQKAQGISPGQRFRLEQWAPHLQHRHGIELDFHAFESAALTRVLYAHGRVATKAALIVKDFVRRANILSLARNYDAVVMHRETSMLGPAVYERLLAWAGIPFVLDFDDAIWMPSEGVSANGVFSKLRFPSKTMTITTLASCVTVGNEYLARWAKQLNGNVHIVPTTINLSMYEVQPESPERDIFTIGWMGSHSTLRHLEEVRHAIERFGATRRVKMVVVCDVPQTKPFAHVETEFVKWSGDREAKDIGGMDVGIMPLPDEPFTRGKCGCKALQYMAAGRPAIVSPVGVNMDIVQHGKNGLLASSDDEWVNAFETLASSRELRRQLANAGRKTVEDRFTAEAAAQKFAQALRSIVPPAINAHLDHHQE